MAETCKPPLGIKPEKIWLQAIKRCSKTMIIYRIKDRNLVYVLFPKIRGVQLCFVGYSIYSGFIENEDIILEQIGIVKKLKQAEKWLKGKRVKYMKIEYKGAVKQ